MPATPVNTAKYGTAYLPRQYDDTREAQTSTDAVPNTAVDTHVKTNSFMYLRTWGRHEVVSITRSSQS